MNFKPLLLVSILVFAITLPSSGYAQQSQEDRQAYYDEGKRKNAVIRLALNRDLAAYKMAVLKTPDAVDFQWTQIYKMDDNDGETALHFAAKNGDMPMLNFLLSKNCNLKLKTSCGDSPLHLAASVQVAQALIDAGANVQAKGNRGRTPLHSAANKAVAEVLLKHGAKIDQRDNGLRVNIFAQSGDYVPAEGDMPLHTAASAGHADVVEFLIEKGADVNARAGDRTALSIAAGRHSDVVKVLLARGATFDSSKSSGSPLWDAVGGNQIKTVKRLLQAKADATMADQHGWNLLHVAALRSRIDAEMFNVLIKAKADVNGLTTEKDTPLHIAAKKGNLTAARILISNGADLQRLNAAGKTPLMLSKELEAFEFRSIAGTQEMVDRARESQKILVREANERRTKIAELIKQRLSK